MNAIATMIHCKYIGQEIAPKDKGNLAFNAISAKLTPEGFTIEYSDTVAPYIEYLENGTRYSGKHVGFISQDTVYAITKYMDDVYNGRQSNETANWKTLAELSKNNPARQMRYLNSMAKARG